MVKSLASWLRWLAEWLDPLPVVEPTVIVQYVEKPAVDEALLSAAKILTHEWEVKLGPGFGEAKRHNVFARLVKQFPDKPKRDLSRVIEDAL